jgi:gliding motility-associated-like protein
MKPVLHIFAAVTLLLCEARAWAQPGTQHPSGTHITINLNNGNHSICHGNPSFSFGSLIGSPVSGGLILEWYVNDVRMDSFTTSFRDPITATRSFVAHSLKAGDSIYCIMTFAWGYNFEKIKSNTIVMWDGTIDPPEVHIDVASTTVCSGSQVTFDPILGPYARDISYIWTVDGVEVQRGAKKQLITEDLKDGAKVELRWIVSACGGGTAYDDAEPVIMRVKPRINPSIEVTTPFSTVCENSVTTFTAKAEDVGNNAAYAWQINGNQAGTNSPVFSTSNLKDGDWVSCQLKTDTATYCSIQPADTVTIQTVKAEPATIAVAASSTTICEDSPVTFTAITTNEGEGASFQWIVNGVKTADTTKTFTTKKLKDGDAVQCVLKTKNPCSASPEIQSNLVTIQVNPLPQFFMLSKDTTLLAGSVMHLEARILANTQLYKWLPEAYLLSPQSITTSTIPLPVGTINFVFEATSYAGCIQQQGVHVAVVQPLYMPNAFTPNGDGINDVFRIPPHSDIDLEEFAVFNRWGNKVFQTKDPSKGWDGSYNNATLAGTYVYVITGKNSSQKKLTIKGTVTLIR